VLDLRDSRILVTGGTGSFGKAFLSYLRENHPDIASIRVFSRDEAKQYELLRTLPKEPFPIELFLGDVKDYRALDRATQGMDIVVHSAAIKQVPMAELNPFECFQTNIQGTQNVIDASIQSGVRRVVALSTDKAVSPIGAYGASKLALEKLMTAAQRRVRAEKTTFSVVRYGNIFGSKGSVVPLFQEQKKQGHLTLTDPAATRFSITIQDSIDLVLFALEHAWGGEIVLRQAPSYGLGDIAKAIAPDTPWKILGLRPSEKLHELLLDSHEISRVSQRDRFLVIAPENGTWSAQGYREETGASAFTCKTSQYCSSQNDWWLANDDIRALLGDQTTVQP
jgi:UDP-N-acetylglucosamine 4,6-dehydratase/5-epimerase